jgi:hypothetical protein
MSMQLFQSKMRFKNYSSWAQWLAPVILATQEMENRRMVIQDGGTEFARPISINRSSYVMRTTILNLTYA